MLPRLAVPQQERQGSQAGAVKSLLLEMPGRIVPRDPHVDQEKLLGVAVSGGGGPQAGMLRLQWELMAGEEEILADLMVTANISIVPGSAERKGSWRGGENQNSPKPLQSNIAQDASWVLCDMLREGLKKKLTFTIAAPNHYENTPTSSAKLQHMFLSQRHLHQMQSLEMSGS